MPEGMGYWDEARLRGVQTSAPAPSAAPATGWSGMLGNSNMYLGGLDPNATQEQAAAHYASLAANNPNMGTNRGFVDPSVYNAVYPNASQADRDAYDKYYRQVQEQINRSPMDGTLTTALGGPLGVIAAFVAAAAGGAALMPSAGAGAAGAAAPAAGGGAAGGAGAAGAGAGAGAGAAGGAGAVGAGGAASALPEIVVTGTVPSAGGAGAAAGAAGGTIGAGSSGWLYNSDPVGSLANTQFGGNAGQLAQSGAISNGAGAFGGRLGQFVMNNPDLIKQAGGLLGGGGGGGGGGAAPVMMGGAGGSPAPVLGSGVPTNNLTLLGKPQPMKKTRGYNARNFRGATVWT